MNPRLNRAGVRRRALHANVPARPGQDDDGDDEVQALRRHVNVHDTRRAAARARVGARHRVRTCEYDPVPASRHTIRPVWNTCSV